jgi:hypothetical protein
MANAADEGGHIVRGPDGALHFLRNSLLEQTRLPDDLAAEAKALLGESDKGGVTGTVASVGRVTSAGKFTTDNVAMSTVMCPHIFNSRLDSVQPESR